VFILEVANQDENQGIWKKELKDEYYGSDNARNVADGDGNHNAGPRRCRGCGGLWN
jgi:hypothetical protein